MTNEQDRIEQMEALMTQMEHEVEILAHAVDEIDRDYNSEYSESVIRAQLQQIGDQVESLSNVVGEGPAISVSEVPITEEKED